MDKLTEFGVEPYENFGDLTQYDHLTVNEFNFRYIEPHIKYMALRLEKSVDELLSEGVIVSIKNGKMLFSWKAKNV